MFPLVQLDMDKPEAPVLTLAQRTRLVTQAGHPAC